MNNNKNINNLSVDIICKDMFETIAHTFPVACASDEFYYFPQVSLAEKNWSDWDCFSPESVVKMVGQLSVWERDIKKRVSSILDFDIQIDLTLLQKVFCTLREQLSEVRTWEKQPTFYLTLACIGLAEAMEADNPDAKHARAKNLADFLDQARSNLVCVPALFKKLGLEMVADTKNYFSFLAQSLPDLHSAIFALDRFENKLRNITTQKSHCLTNELLEHVFYSHLNFELDRYEINLILSDEIEEMRQILAQEAGKLLSNQQSPQNWEDALKRIPNPYLGDDGLIGLYKNEIDKLARHCQEQELVSSNLLTCSPVHVAAMPAFLSAIRTASSYSISPNHPPRGGFFYILNASASENKRMAYHREYRMLSAHQTYPGHHLLDTYRWNHIKPIRRFIEQPVFYEGWACFAEELMWLTGYFSTAGDRLLLAKRRLWRAMRGKVDIGLQTGTMNLTTATNYLRKTGINLKQASSAARKYPLNPGYQLCYTLGLRRFLDLFNHYGLDNIKYFVQTILDQGEIGFFYLDKILARTQK